MSKETVEGRRKNQVTERRRSRSVTGASSLDTARNCPRRAMFN